MEIHLIRHGKTAANEEKRYYGKTDLPMSPQGIDCLAELHRQGIYPEIADLFFTSGLLRAEQTLAYLYGSVQRIALPELAEYHFGQFEMKTHEELKERADYQAWITDDSGHLPCPDGESRQQFMSRILAGYGLLVEKAKAVESVVLISHGGVIASIMDHLFPDVNHFYGWQPKPGRGYTLTYRLDECCQFKTI